MITFYFVILGIGIPIKLICSEQHSRGVFFTNGASPLEDAITLYFIQHKHDVFLVFVKPASGEWSFSIKFSINIESINFSTIKLCTFSIMWH